MPAWISRAVQMQHETCSFTGPYLTNQLCLAKVWQASIWWFINHCLNHDFALHMNAISLLCPSLFPIDTLYPLQFTDIRARASQNWNHPCLSWLSLGDCLHLQIYLATALWRYHPVCKWVRLATTCSRTFSAMAPTWWHSLSETVGKAATHLSFCRMCKQTCMRALLGRDYNCSSVQQGA